MAEERCVDRWISITTGLRGTFPVLMGQFWDGVNSWIEPITSGLTCRDYKEAELEAMSWAKAEGIRCDIVDIPSIEEVEYIPPPPETLTCFDCDQRKICAYVDDPYNINGDCLAMK